MRDACRRNTCAPTLSPTLSSRHMSEGWIRMAPDGRRLKGSLPEASQL